MLPTRDRTDWVLLDSNLAGSARSAPAIMLGSESKSSVPWKSIRLPNRRCAVPETLRPSTRMSFRPDASASSPNPRSASTTGRMNC